MNKNFKFFLIFLFCSEITLFGQNIIVSNEMKFDRLTIDQGLSQSLVFDIHQDDDGYLWFATQDGLNRYDGYSFKVYRNRINDFTSLSHNDIHAIDTDNNGNLWLATAGGGLNRFDTRTGKFISFRSRIDDPNSLSNDYLNCLLVDRNGLIWIGTNGNGLDRFDPKTNKFTNFYIVEESALDLKSNIISHIYEDNQGRLWIGSDLGLYLFDQEKGNFKYHELLSVDKRIKVSVIREDEDQNLWIGLDGYGLIKFSPESGEVNHFNLASMYTDNPSINKIRTLTLLQSGKIALGSYGGGLGVFNPITEELMVCKNNPQRPTTLSDDHIFTVFQDQSRILWVGTFRGVDKLDMKPRKFEHFKLADMGGKESTQMQTEQSNFVLSIIKDREKNIWFGTLGAGLYKINGESGKIENYRYHRSNKFGLKDNYIWSLYRDRSANIWVGTGLGLHRYDRKNNRFVIYDIKAPEKTNDNLVRAIYEDREGNLWIGFYGVGLHKYVPGTDTFTSYRHIHMKPDGRQPYLILSLFQDHRGELWIGTDGGGLFRFNPYDQIFFQYAYEPTDANGIKSPRVNAITEDKGKNLWIGTSNGLVILHPDRDSLDHYSENDGLANSFIYAVEIDRSNDVWVSTNRGLTRIRKRGNSELQFRNYDVDDGLQSNEFNTHSSFQTTEGELFFGGINGYSHFLPENVRNNTTIPPLSITNIQIGDAVREGNPNKTSVEVNYSDNTITLEFASLEYTNPLKNQYKYKLEGFDENWILAGTRRFTTYTNLDPGEYTFRVRGSNNDGLWNEEDTWVNIHVVPPLWQSMPAYFTYLILFVLGLVLFIRWRERKLESDKRILEQKVEEKTVELKESYYKLERSQKELMQATKTKAIGTMASGMAHSFNNILMVILGSSQLLKEKVGNSDLKKPLLTIEQAANDGAEIIKKLQTFGRGDEDSIPKLFDLNEVVQDVIEVSRFKWSDQKSIQGIKVEIESALGEIPLVNGNVSELRLVFIDIILNAIEAYTSSGIIKISTNYEDDKVIVRVKDKGVGIDKKTLEHIFDPFFTTKGKQGDGLGLSQVYGVINQHGGTITVESNPGEGTEVVIKLPAGPIFHQTTKREEKAQKIEGEKSVFIVEDEPMIRDVYHEMLTMKGYQVSTFPSGEEALKVWKKNTHNLIICDLGLPGMNGWEFISKIRQNDSHIPIIVLTGWGSEIGDDRALELNVQNVLAKPVSLENLLKNIVELVG